MEFNEKLQELRKSRGLTQEELAEELYVSRTAISKWESGRGYPSIESLKQIANYFSVTIDDLLSGEKLLSIAEKENKTNMRNMCHLLIAFIDFSAISLVVLPLYPNVMEGFVYSVNLLAYSELSLIHRIIYWSIVALLILCGSFKLVLIRMEKEKYQRIITIISLLISIVGVLYFALRREAYAITVLFILLILKGLFLIKQTCYNVPIK